MSQRKEKYARNMERRTGELEEKVDLIRERMAGYGGRLTEIERSMDRGRTIYDNEVDRRRQEEIRTGRESRRQRREIERAIDRQRIISLIALILAIVAVMWAAMAMWDKPEEKTARADQSSSIIVKTIDRDDAMTLLADTALDFSARYQVERDPAKLQRIEEALLMQGYFSDAVPMCYEYQDYMRVYCRMYGCPYPLALAVADWETRGQFNMDTVGPAGEVGIMQLNPGPDGAYHAELEAATGLDPTTPEGNIAGGCYKLGKYLEQYDDVTMAIMAYNMGQAGARRAWEKGITSTEYTEAVLAALERWECAVNAWAGE